MGEVIGLIALLLAIFGSASEDSSCVIIVRTDWAGESHAISGIDFDCFGIDDFDPYVVENPFYPD